MGSGCRIKTKTVSPEREVVKMGSSIEYKNVIYLGFRKVENKACGLINSRRRKIAGLIE